jgi:GntR family transcriptional regulator/MocR family aminotransferase
MLLELRRDDPEPLHRQIEREIRAGIHAGRFASGSALPSTRALADTFGLSRGVVVEAYEQLIAEGYLVSRHGGGTRVTMRAPAAAPAALTRPGVEYRIDFAYGRPDVTGFPRQAWMRSIRRVMVEAPSARLSYLEGRGALELREALTVYLDRVRGTVATPDRIVICNGFAQALHLALEVFADIGVRQLAVEDPGQIDTPVVARRHGLSVAAIPADEDGIVVDELARSNADAVVVTPAHHFPIGGVLPPSRRDALIAWADAGSRFILEDDYDAEYRYDRAPIGAIQGLAPERVLYAGSASKVLAPGLRLGWLVAPDALVDRLALAKEASDRGSAGIEQLAFADFLARGGFDHHVRRMRPIYRRRRDRLLAALARHVPSARPVGASAGLHLVAMLPQGIDEDAVVDGAAADGVRVYGIRRYQITGQARPAGLVFGYGAISEAEIDEGVRVVGRVLDAIRSAGAAGSSAWPADGENQMTSEQHL